jgi:pyridoxine 5-phosphate synthase
LANIKENIEPMTKLSVNINKIATLRNARGGNVPDLLKFATEAQGLGADGITIHPRPDERHIKRQDVLDLKKVVYTDFNIEGYPSDAFLELVLQVKPEQVTLVPDAPDAITSNAGWDVAKNSKLLKKTIDLLKKEGIASSLFLDTNLEQVRMAAEIGANRIELYTGPYANAQNLGMSLMETLEALRLAAEEAQTLGLAVNAGHDLNLNNIKALKHFIPFLREVSVGQGFIADCLYLGLPETVKKYKTCLK